MLDLRDPQTRSAAIRLMRLDKPIGTFLLMWPTLGALWFAAGGEPSIKLLIIFVLGVFVTRSAGCVINDYNDRYIDAYVARTKDRPLPAGEIEPKAALLLFGVLVLIAFVLVLQTNRLTVILSVGALALAAIYPILKRFIYFPQIVLGAAFGWAIPMAYTAQTGTVSTVTWLLFIANLLWTTAYDTIYAMVDRDDDLAVGVRSTAILFGDIDRLAIGIMQALFLITMIMVGTREEMGLVYYGGLLIAAVLCVYQHTLIRNQYPDECFKAFLNNNYVGLVIFVGIVTDFWLSAPPI